MIITSSHSVNKLGLKIVGLWSRIKNTKHAQIKVGHLPKIRTSYKMNWHLQCTPNDDHNKQLKISGCLAFYFHTSLQNYLPSDTQEPWQLHHSPTPLYKFLESSWPFDARVQSVTLLTNCNIFVGHTVSRHCTHTCQISFPTCFKRDFWCSKSDVLIKNEWR